MGKSRITFLDIDGVLAGYEYLCLQRKEPFTFIDPEKCGLLNQLNGAEIVISSSWGYNEGRTEETLKACGLELPIIGYTKKLHYQFKWACRGNEIEEWIQRTYGRIGTCFGPEYDSEDYDYVIFDDDQDMLLGQAGHFIHVDRMTGLTQADIDKAKKILKYDNCD